MYEYPHEKEIDSNFSGDSIHSSSPDSLGCLPALLAAIGPIFIIFIIFVVAIGSGSSKDSDQSANSTRGTIPSFSYTSSSFPTFDFSSTPTIPEGLFAIPSTTSPTYSNPIEFISYPRVTRRNEEVSVTIKGKPNTRYSITVEYSSGSSTADGLESKYSNGEGYVTWNWHVGGKTNPGTFQITVAGGGEIKKVNFTVVE